MATPSEVKAGLDQIAQEIRAARQALKNAQARVQNAYNDLDSIPTDYSDVITTIDAYTGADAFEEQAQADKAALETEFLALQTKASNANDDLAAYDFSD